MAAVFFDIGDGEDDEAMAIPAVPLLADWTPSHLFWERPLATVVPLPPPWPPAAPTPPRSSSPASLATGDEVLGSEPTVPAPSEVTDPWAELDDDDAAAPSQPPAPFDAWSTWDAPAPPPSQSAPAALPPSLDAWGNPEPSPWAGGIQQPQPPARSHAIIAPSQPPLALDASEAVEPPPALDAWGNPVAKLWVPRSGDGGMAAATQPPAIGVWSRQPSACLPSSPPPLHAPYDPWEVAVLPASGAVAHTVPLLPPSRACGASPRSFGSPPSSATPYGAFEN